MFSAEQIKSMRTKMMMSQEEFAKELDISAITIVRWETGKYSPTFKAQRKLKEFCEKNKLKVE